MWAEVRSGREKAHEKGEERKYLGNYCGFHAIIRDILRFMQFSFHAAENKEFGTALVVY